MTASLEGLDAEVESLQAERERRSTTPCGVAAVKSQLSADDAARLDRIIAGRAWAKTIEQALAKHGIELTRLSIERHRRGMAGGRNGCSCPS